jgi:hypothetical protein
MRRAASAKAAPDRTSDFNTAKNAAKRGWRSTEFGLHHTKKGGAEYPLEALSGSNGLSACADTTIVLDSDQDGKTLYVRGRDAEEKETAVRPGWPGTQSEG